MAGLGADLSGVTMRDLFLRTEALARERWGHTSTLLALIANCNRDPQRRRRPFEPRDFNPYAHATRKRGVRITAGNIGLLRDLFLKDEHGG